MHTDNLVSDSSSASHDKLTPEIEARLRAWMQSAEPMPIASRGESKACIELLRLCKQQADTVEDRLLIKNLIHLTGEYAKEESRSFAFVKPETMARLKVKRAEATRLRDAGSPVRLGPRPSSGMYTDWSGRQRFYTQIEPGVRYGCPCCYFLTLPERNGYDICPVCYWQDDGQNEHDAGMAYESSNYGFSLTDARRNYCSFGASAKRVLPYVRPPLDRECHGF